MKTGMTALLASSLLLVGCGDGGSGSGDRGSTSSSLAPTSSLARSAVAPSDAFVPLFPPGTQVIEQIQYSEADGTLVTYAGFRPTPRHAREGGEEWTDPVDKGPGSYLAFPPFYFQNRTFGLVIRDEVPAGRQRITAYLKPNAGILINNSFNAFRRLDPGVIEYGWKLGVGWTAASAAAPPTRSKRCAWPRSSSPTTGDSTTTGSIRA